MRQASAQDVAPLVAMPAYTTDPDQLESELRALPITFEPIEDVEEDGMSGPDRRLMERYFPEAKEGTPASIRVYQQLCKKYPEIAVLKNHLSVAFEAAGKKRQSKKVEEEIFRQHPDYLFGRINRAAAQTRDEDELHLVPETLGERLRLDDILPDQPVYHFTQIRGFYHSVALFHLRAGRFELARRLHRVLVDLIGEDDLALQQLEQVISMQSMAELTERVLEDEECQIRVEVPPKTDEDGGGMEMFPPTFRNEQVRCVYEYGLDFPADEIEILLALPKESLASDLEDVLRDAAARAPLYLNDRMDRGDCETWFPVHALILLGEVGTVESLSAVFDVFSQSEEALEYWFGEMLEGHLWMPVFKLLLPQPEAAFEWMLSPGIHQRGRSVVGQAVAQIALHQPDRRAEVIDWFERVLKFLLDSPPEDNILDTRLVSQLVSSLCDIRAVELRDLIAAHQEKGYVSELLLGDMAEIDGYLTETDVFKHRKGIKSFWQLYRELNATFGERDEDFHGPAPDRRSTPAGPGMPALGGVPGDGFLPDWSGPSAAVAAPKIGRNEPCPCGSGKKYKKCCG